MQTKAELDAFPVEISSETLGPALAGPSGRSSDCVFVVVHLCSDVDEHEL